MIELHLFFVQDGVACLESSAKDIAKAKKEMEWLIDQKRKAIESFEGDASVDRATSKTLSRYIVKRSTSCGEAHCTVHSKWRRRSGEDDTNRAATRIKKLSISTPNLAPERGEEELAKEREDDEPAPTPATPVK